MSTHLDSGFHGFTGQTTRSAPDPSPLQRNAPQHHHDRALRIANDTESLPHHQRGRDDGRKVERLHEDLPNTNEMSVRSAKGRRRDRTCRTPSRRKVAISSENMEGRVVGREGGLELEDGRDGTCSFELGWIQCEVDGRYLASCRDFEGRKEESSEWRTATRHVAKTRSCSTRAPALPASALPLQEPAPRGD